MHSVALSKRAAIGASFVILLTGCHQALSTGTPPDQLRGTQVVDGDTLSGVDQDGKRVRVRLIGIDAPELAHEGDPNECGAVGARDSLRDLVQGQDVTLVNDPKSDRIDRFGRRLAYVEMRGVDVALWQVARGHAGAWYPRGEPRPQRQDAYRQAERDAQEGHVGAWAACRTLGR